MRGLIALSAVFSGLGRVLVDDDPDLEQVETEPLSSLRIGGVPNRVVEVFLNFDNDTSLRCNKKNDWIFDEKTIYSKDDILGIDLLWDTGHIDIILEHELTYHRVGLQQDWEVTLCCDLDSGGEEPDLTVH